MTKAKKVVVPQGAFYFVESTENHTEGYLELQPHTSLEIHNRPKGFENLTQIENECVMVVFDNVEGTTHLLKPRSTLRIEPEGTWHIHVNPFGKPSLTHFYFEGDIKDIVENLISKGSE